MTGGSMDSARLGRAGRYAAGSPAARGGRWAGHGPIGIPGSITDGASHEVAPVATDGRCWRGQGRFAIFTHTPAAIAGAGDLGPC